MTVLAASLFGASLVVYFMSLQVQRATRKLREEVVAHYSRSTQARDDVLAMMAAHTAAIVERSAVLEKKVAEHPRTDVN